MEEDTVELIDYLRVIRKRKILIIVVTLVCIGVGVGVGVMNSRSKSLPVTSYHASANLKIGKKVRVVSSGISIITSSVVEYIEDPGHMVESIPLKYDFKVNESPGYHFDVKRVGTLAMLKLILKGPDKGVERVLKELVDMLIDEHRRKAKDSVVSYNNFMKKLEADAKMVQKNITKAEASIKEMKVKEGEYLVSIESSRAEIKEESGGGDRSAFLNMLYLKTIDEERELSSRRADLRKIQWQLIMHQITLGNLEEYKTELVGKIKSTAIEPEKKKKKSTINMIIVAGVVGLMLSLFLAFLMEYLWKEKEKARARARGKDNSA